MCCTAQKCQQCQSKKNTSKNSTSTAATTDTAMEKNRVCSTKGGWMRQSASPPMIGGPIYGSLVSCNWLQLPVVAFILQLDSAEHKPTMTITNDGMLDTSHKTSGSSNDNNSNNNLNKMKKRLQNPKNERIRVTKYRRDLLVVGFDLIPKCDEQTKCTCKRKCIAVSTDNSTGISGN